MSVFELNSYSQFYLCSLGCFCEQRCLAVLLLQVISLPLFFVFLQVFGDYYHFRHHAVERRALSGHKGMHIKLQKEPQVSCQHSNNPLWHSLLATKTKWQIGLHINCVCIIRDKGVATLMTACQILFTLKSLSFHLSPWPNQQYNLKILLGFDHSNNKEQELLSKL